MPIAIIGAACRLPGVANVQEFWDVLVGGRDTITEVPADRRDYLSGDFFKYAGFLDQIDGFDANFFGVSPYEAVRLDPHHRVLLETVSEALEDAGLPAERLAGSRTGVYTSCFAGHYWHLLRDAGMHDVHAILGSHRSTVPAGRIAHWLDLRGPSIETESHCASSLVAVHLACQALRSGEIGMAIVGAVNLLMTPHDRLGLSDSGIISPTYRCRFGDESADGYVPADGAVTVILKPLDAALAAGDQVYATILGSAVSSNGRQALSASATGTTGQEDMLRLALRSAGVAPAEIDYIEAHGPGTPLGDIVELTALRQVVGEGRDPDQRCLVGSAKSNIGHTEAAAGLVGLLKTALAVRHRTVPATLHVRRPIAELRGDDVPVELARSTRPWPDRGRPAVAGVTALGMFGIGAHVVLTEAPPAARSSRPARSSAAMLLPLSTKDPMALRTLASAYADALATASRPRDVCFSAGARRTQHPHRLAVVGADRHALVDRLRRLACGGPAGGVPTEQVFGPPRVVFVFSGQGSHWPGMARELLRTEPRFARTMRACDRQIRAERGWSLLDRLLDELPLTVEHEVQPALWAIQVSLAELWRHWGIEPDQVIGHSMGEAAAATVAGALSLRDGARVICQRSALVGTLDNPGGMVAVELGERDAREAIGDLADRVSVAVVNSSRSTVLAGDREALDAVSQSLRERGVPCRQVGTNYASHSRCVEPLREALLAALAPVRPRPARIPMRSTVWNRVVRGDELDAAYWMANIRQPVRFAPAVRAALAESGPTLFIEISPHPLLVAAIERGIEEFGTSSSVVVPSLVREMPERESLLTSLGTTYTRGCAPVWEHVYEGGQYTTLPTYPWQRKRYWASATTEQASAPPPTRQAKLLLTVIPSVAALTEHIVRHAAEVLAASPDSVDPARPLYVAGMDSVLAVKLRMRLKQELDLHVPVADFLDDRSLTELASHLHDRVSGRS